MARLSPVISICVESGAAAILPMSEDHPIPAAIRPSSVPASKRVIYPPR